MGCMIPHPFAAGGNRSYPEFRVVTDDPQYPYIFIYIYRIKVECMGRAFAMSISKG
jgi:hypothetical protein